MKKDLERVNDTITRKFEQVGQDQNQIKQRIDKSIETNGKKIKVILEEVDQLKHHLVTYFN